MALVDYTATRASMESYIDTNFTMVPIQFENVPLDVNDPTESIALFDKIDDVIDNTLQPTGVLCRGTLIIQIFTKVGIGTARAREIAVALSTIISSKTINNISFGHGEFFGIPSDPKGTYYQHNLNFRYSFVYGENPDC